MDHSGSTTPARTNAFGYYRINDAVVGETYFLSVRSTRCSFADPTHVITPNDNLTDIDFIAGPF